MVITTPATADAGLVIEGSSKTTFYVFQKSIGQLYAKVETVDGAIWAAQIKSADGAKIHALFDVIANIGLGIRL